MNNPGARFIWNSRYFHIAKSGEMLSKFAVSGTHAQGLVEYCGTRETVALNIEENSQNLLATEKQKELIENLCRAVPDYKTTLEYEDYTKAPTRQNASELIAILSEQVLLNGAFDEASNLVEYTAQRPGVVKVGSHGLFSYEDNVDLLKAKEEIANHKGNIWTHVLSLRREDADKLGYDNQDSWKKLVKSNLTVIAEAHNIKLSNLRWYAAMHNTGYHPHIHLFVFSENPNEGFFSQKGENNSIHMCKQAFATKIFASDLENEYVAKTEYREELKNSTKKILDKLAENPLGEYSSDIQKALIEKLITLSKSISPSKEVKYGYLKSDLKELVNDIQRTLVYENKSLSELYMKWCEHQFNIEKVYIQHPTEVPIDENNEFTPIKNHIIKVAQQLRGEIKLNHTHQNIDSADKSTLIKEQITQTLDRYPEYDKLSDVDKFNELHLRAVDTKARDGDDCCRLAEYYRYGVGTKVDLGKAMMWYGISADQYHNGIASYKLAEFYEKGLVEGERNDKLANSYYQQAFYVLKFGIKNWSCFDDIEAGKKVDEFYDKVPKYDAIKEYMIGRMYYDGKGVEQNYSKAFYSFLLSAEHGNTSAMYYVGDMCLNGKGVEANTDTATKYFIKATQKGHAHSAFALYKFYSKADGAIKGLSENFLKQASENGHPIAQLKVANVELEEGNISKAVELYESASKSKIADAHYKLGEIYSNPDINDFYNEDIAKKHYKTAFDLYMQDFNKKPNGYLAYNIAKMHHNGYGVEKNTAEAIKWYKAASQLNGNDYKQEIETAEREATIPLGMIGSTVLHIGRIFRNNTLNSHKKRYTPDKKTLRQEKEQKTRAGQAQDDYDDYDYNY